MSWYALDVLDDALDETTSLLLPFDLWLWVRLAIITFFVGTGGQPATSFQFDDGMTGVGGMPGGMPDIGPIIVAIAVFAALLGLLFTFVGSVMEFVFVDVVRSRDVRIRAPFRDHLGDGLRLFGFRLALFVVVAVAVLALVAPLVAAGFLGGAGPATFLLVLVFLPVFFVVALVVALVHEFTSAFVVPLMIEDGRGVLGTWRAFWPELRAAWKEFAVYALVRFGLAILAGMIFGVAAGILFLPVIAGFGFAVFTGGMPAAPVLVALGVVFLVLLAVTTVFVQMPITTYLRYHSLLTLDVSEIEFTLRENESPPTR